MTPFLHVTNGGCAAGVIEAAALSGTVSVWGDPLYAGPVPGGLTDEQLLDVRARFLAPPGATAYAETVVGLKGWRTIIEEHAASGELVLWFEHDLFDQLNLIQLLSWMRGRLPASKVVSLVCIGSFPGRRAFKGLGELTPGELASLVDTRQPVGEAQYALADEAWRAFRAPTPQALDRVRRGDTTALPFLAPALRRFLEEYPSTTDGLSRTERRLLQLASDGRVALRTIFPRMHDDETAYYVTDSSLSELADELASTSPPLLTLDGKTEGGASSAPAGTATLAATVALADAGREVLSGRRDRVTACGIDRWLGGVHLQSGAPIWRWDGDRDRVVKNGS